MNFQLPNGHIVMQELDTQLEPSPEELEEYAEVIGIDVQTEKHLLYIAREGWQSQLPKDWVAVENTMSNDLYYMNIETKEITWDHPMEDYFRNKVKAARQKHDSIRSNDSMTKGILVRGESGRSSGHRVAFLNITNMTMDLPNPESFKTDDPNISKSPVSSASERVTSSTPTNSRIPRLSKYPTPSPPKQSTTQFDVKSVQTENIALVDEGCLTDFDAEKESFINEAKENLFQFKRSLFEETKKMKSEYCARAQRQIEDNRSLWENRKHLQQTQQDSELRQFRNLHEELMQQERQKQAREKEQLLARHQDELTDLKRQMERLRQSLELDKERLMDEHRRRCAQFEKMHQADLDAIKEEATKNRLRHASADEHDNLTSNSGPKSFDINTASIVELNQEKLHLNRKIERVKTMYKDYKKRVLAVEEMALHRLLKDNSDNEMDDVTLSLDITTAPQYNRMSTVARPNNLSIKGQQSNPLPSGFHCYSMYNAASSNAPSRHSLDVDRVLSPNNILRSHSSASYENRSNYLNRSSLSSSSDLVQRMKALESHLRDIKESPQKCEYSPVASKENDSSQHFHTHEMRDIFELSDTHITFQNLNASLPIWSSPNQEENSAFARFDVKTHSNVGNTPC